jgi:subtilase family serine protease
VHGFDYFIINYRDVGQGKTAAQLKNLILDNSDTIQISIPGNSAQNVRRLNAYQSVLAASGLIEHDLVVRSLEGTTTIKPGETGQYTIRVYNNGLFTANNYTVQFIVRGNIIGSNTSSNLAAGEYQDFTFTWTPTNYGDFTLTVL